MLAESEELGFLEFPVARIPEIAQAFPELEICLSTSTTEMREDGPVIRELALAKIG